MKNTPEGGHPEEREAARERERYQLSLSFEELTMLVGALNTEHNLFEDRLRTPAPPSEEITVEQVHEQQDRQQLAAVNALRAKLLALVEARENSA